MASKTRLAVSIVLAAVGTSGSVVILLSSSSPFAASRLRSIASTPIDCKTPIEAPVTFEKVKDRIDTCGIVSVEDTLAALPESYRSSFTLMRRSKSAQGALPDFPRAILFGSDARLMMTFNGKASERGYNEIEAIQYEDQSKRFTFHQIAFSPDLKSKPTYDADLQSCTNCHRAGLRPNWEAYDLWDGAYGQVEDQIKIGSQEDLDFQKFLKNRNTGRYKFLVGSADLRAPSIAEVAGYAKVGQSGAYSMATLPNFRLTFFLNLLNYPRIAEIIRNTPDFSSYKYAYFGALFGCGPIQDFLPSDISSKFANSYDQVLQDTIQKLSAQYAKRVKEDGPFDPFQVFNGDTAPQNFEAVSASRFIIAKLRYLSENRGISMKDWSLSPIPDAYIFSDGELYLKEVARSFEPDLKQIPGLTLDYVRLEESSFPALFGQHASDFSGMTRLSCCSYDTPNPEPKIYDNGNCSILKRLSLAAFRHNSPAPISSSEASGSSPITPAPPEGYHRGPDELINVCISCHRVDNGSGLVFQDLHALQAMLGQSGYPHGKLRDEIRFRLTTNDDGMKMPPYEGLMSDGERAALAKFLSP